MSDDVEAKYLRVHAGSFRLIPVNSPQPVVVICEGAELGSGPPTPGTGPRTPDPGKIPQLTPRNPGILERVSAETLGGFDLEALSEEVSTIVVEVDPSDPESLSAVGELLQEPGLAQRGIDVEVRGG